MNNQEAIESLRENYCCNRVVCELHGVDLCQKEKCEIWMAISALEKQIPKNPIVNGDRNEAWVEDALICPVCNQYFGSAYNVGYCKTCGQKLIQKRISVV